jgi:LysR family transcriptional regulator, low CO2-responsive transcriptional regulator
MTLHQFTIFAAIAKHGSLTRASQQLHLTESCVSQQMRLLQEEYRARLYNRVARGVELTNAGRNFLTAIMPILEQVSRLTTSSGKAVTPDADLLVVGATYSTSTILLPSLLSRFKKSHPGIQIDFRSNNGAEIERLLLKEKIEIAVTTRLPSSRRIMAEPFRRERLVLVVSRSHPLARAREIALHDIECTPLLVRSSGGRDGATVKRLKSLLEEKGIKVNIGMRFESPSAMKEAIQRKMGIGLLYEEVARYNLERHQFKEIKIRGLKLEVDSCIVYLKEKPLSKAADEFLKLLRSSAGKRQASRKASP